jgi:iron complex transport system substrate-binding protein
MKRRGIAHIAHIVRIVRIVLIVVMAAVTLRAHAQPKRIVTLVPSLTETVCVLGHCDSLVAVDDFSNWPEQVRRLPHVGGLEDANVESIVALKPDIVLLTSSSRALARLRGLGIDVLAMEPKTVADVHAAFDRVGALLGEGERAQREWRRVNEGIERAAASVPASRRGVRVYFEVDSGPYAAGEISHIGELLKRLGAANIVPASLGSVPKLNPEFVVRADPQVIMIGAREAAEMRRRPGWDRISAIREGRVCTLDAEQGDVIARPGPRLADAARILAQCLTR